MILRQGCIAGGTNTYSTENSLLVRYNPPVLSTSPLYMYFCGSVPGSAFYLVRISLNRNLKDLIVPSHALEDYELATYGLTRLHPRYDPLVVDQFKPGLFGQGDQVLLGLGSRVRVKG